MAGKLEDDELRLLLLRIADKSDETQKSIIGLDKKVDLHIQKTEYELKEINKLDQIQNQQLADHIEGVNTLKKMYEAHEKADADRFADIEAPRKWFKFTVKFLMGMGALAGSIMAVIKFLHWF
jgi:hypothetical protein